MSQDMRLAISLKETSIAQIDKIRNSPITRQSVTELVEFVIFTAPASVKDPKALELYKDVESAAKSAITSINKSQYSSILNSQLCYLKQRQLPDTNRDLFYRAYVEELRKKGNIALSITEHHCSK